MAQTQHTPGPWMAKRAPDGPIDIFDSRGRDVVTLYGGGVESESKEANARLIAAAPDMLVALKRLVEWNGKRGFASPEAPDELLPPEEQSIEVAEGMAAIAKAEGSTNA